MTREEIYDEFEVDERGVVRSPGKFEGEPAYAVYFWTTGDPDYVDDDDRDVFVVNEDDRFEWPELKEVKLVTLYHDEQGFLYAEETPL